LRSPPRERTTPTKAATHRRGSPVRHSRRTPEESGSRIQKPADVSRSSRPRCRTKVD
jgi:hypothetical protein